MREASSWGRDVLAHKQTALVPGAEMDYINISVPNQQMAANNDFHSLSGATGSKPVPHCAAYDSIPTYSVKVQISASSPQAAKALRWDFFRDTNGKGPVTLPG